MPPLSTVQRCQLNECDLLRPGSLLRILLPTVTLCVMQLTQVLGALELELHEPGASKFHLELAGKINASLKEHPEALDLCLERLRHLVLSDRVGFYLEVSADWEDDRVLLRGDTERLEFKDITREVFRALGFAAVEDRVRIVPDPETNPEPYGLVAAPHLLTWSTPALRGLPMDEALYGEPVYLLKETPDAWLIKTLTGYWGYARKDGIRRVGKPEFIRWLNAPKATLLHDHAMDDRMLPSGCRLILEEGDEGSTSTVSTPEGGRLVLPKSLLLTTQREPGIERVLKYARGFLDAPYNLGGKNRTGGIDCSGLVQLSYRVLGVNLPRDAKQQYLGGHLILPCVREALLPGDALFFMNTEGLVDHVALYLGADQVLHATGNAVRIDSTDPQAPNYLRRLAHDFIGAKRYWH